MGLPKGVRNTVLAACAGLFAGGLIFAAGSGELSYRKAVSFETAGDYDEAVRLFGGIAGYRDAADRMTEAKYQKACRALSEGETEIAEGIFLELGEYRDSSQKIPECSFLRGRKFAESGEYERALGEFSDAAASTYNLQETEEEIRHCHYEIGCRLLENGDYKQAEKEFELSDGFRGSSRMILECRYREAGELFESGMYIKARDLFRTLDAYKDSRERVMECRYELALEKRKDLMHPVTAIAAFRSLGDYRDAAEITLLLEYEYVKSHFEAKDPMTARYLTELRDENYGDSAELYEELYGWEIRITANASENDTESDIDKTSAASVIWWHIRVLKGPPFEERTEVRAVATFPNGQQIDEWEGLHSFMIMDRAYFSANTYFVDPPEGEPGNMTFEIFDMDGRLMSSKTVVLE